MGWNEQEEELILHCASDFLLFERKMVKEQLVHEGIKEESILYYDGSRVRLTDIRLI